jgi:hypothetical protein
VVSELTSIVAKQGFGFTGQGQNGVRFAWTVSEFRRSSPTLSPESPTTQDSLGLGLSVELEFAIQDFLARAFTI